MPSCFYIGTRERLFEMRAPSINMPAPKVGFANQLDFVNGGISIRQSVAAHKRYDMTWGLLDRDEARIVLDLADGVHGSGLIYWHDPFAADRNVLPQQWASPFQGTSDGVPLNAGERPQRVTTVQNTLNFPTFSARYDVTTPNTKRVWIPIPPGHSAHIGVYGQPVTGGEMLAIPTFSDGSFIQPIPMQLMSLADNSRTNFEVKSSDGYNGVFLRLGGNGLITIAGMMVQVLPEGQAVEPGGFISGQGQSGARFLEQPQYNAISAAQDRVSVVASFAETGTWE
jgi:hypothetical protein